MDNEQGSPLARFCAIQSKLYDDNKLKALVIDQVLDWSNEITNKIAEVISLLLAI